mgnify:CR=1 FL=1
MVVYKMNALFIIIGLVLLLIHWCMRFSRTRKEGISIFSGSIMEEAVFQWIGFILVFIGLLI